MNGGCTMPSRNLRTAIIVVAVVIGMAWDAPCLAQDNIAGRPVDTAVGQVGQRGNGLPSGQAGPPNRRIDGRISTRIQNRLKNRIDRFYDPNVDPASSLKTAVGQLSGSQRTPR